MTLLVPELNRIVSRLAIVAADERHLKETFEAIALELTEGLGAHQPMHMTGAALPQGPLRIWNSFTLGRRAGSEMRLSLLGAAFEDVAEAPLLLELVDALFFYIPQNTSDIETLLKLSIPSEARTKPVVIWGLSETPEEMVAHQDPIQKFKRKALDTWFHRNFHQTSHVALGDKSLPKALEWALSFS